jgi:hypothetical protein
VAARRTDRSGRHVESVLRDEFADIKREAAGERIAGEDAAP